jgi:hypothetical protein
LSIDPRAFGLAAGAVAAISFTLCALGVALAPAPTTAMLSAPSHLDLSNLARPLTGASFVGGLVGWSICTAAALAVAAACYNRFAIPS